MDEGQEFVDYYKRLGVDPCCSDRELEQAYHALAKRYHPDNRATADLERFTEVLAAYRELKDPAARAEYDQRHFPDKGKAAPLFGLATSEGFDEITAVNDAEMHARILMHLYKRRRENPSDAGVVQWLLEEALGCSPDEIDFHVWYLRAKGFIEVVSNSGLAITIAGVDEVISTSRGHQAKQILLLKAMTADKEEPAP